MFVNPEQQSLFSVVNKTRPVCSISCARPWAKLVAVRLVREASPESCASGDCEPLVTLAWWLGCVGYRSLRTLPVPRHILAPSYICCKVVLGGPAWNARQTDGPRWFYTNNLLREILPPFEMRLICFNL